jgi:2-polyprenyl-6-hydroxyphenyl methylase/3-demethylubiquinone-9 3-methyltransferase
MGKPGNLLDQSSHFAFGENWARYAELVTEAEIEGAMRDLSRLSGNQLAGKRFLDIGCGSGVHAVAALRLGASEVVAVDIDPTCVSTARRVLQAYCPDHAWRVEVHSVFALTAADYGQFDVVYSWGALHHTGDLYRAVRCAAQLVKPGGAFIFALYRRTPLCTLWAVEKRWYARAGRRGQALARMLYVALYRAALWATGRSFRHCLADYSRRRGMDFYHDVHDWLGGWPYESISPAETEAVMQQMNLHAERTFLHPVKALGLLGSGCDEYVYRKAAA